MLCGDGPETVDHFVKYCRFLAPCNSRMMRKLRSALPLAGEAGRRWLKELYLSNDDWLNTIVYRPDAVVAEDELCGLALWMMDKAVKKCLVAMWRLRESVVGRLNMVAGKLVIVPCSGASVADLLARQELTRVMTAADVARYRHFWIHWYNKRKVDLAVYD